VTKLVPNMTGSVLEAAQRADLADALMFRTQHVERILGTELDHWNDHVPGVGDEAKIITPKALEQMAHAFRTFCPRYRKQAAE